MTRRQIARGVSVSRPTVSFYLDEAARQGLTFDRVNALSDEEIDGLLTSRELGRPKQGRALPDWEYIHREMTKKSVTIQLLWREYKESYPEGYQSSQFCDLYRAWRKGLDLSMRQTHKAGERMFVDYAGQTIPIHDPSTGEVRQAQIFVAVLGLSNYTYSEATLDQSLPSWIGSHVRAFEYFGGVSRLTIADNLKSGVIKTCRYEPDLNPAYQEMAAHYGTAIVPARVRHPKDKSKVEGGVLIVERWILASLRNRKFFSLEELNQVIREMIRGLNIRPFKKLKGTRKEWFELFDKSELLPLPEAKYVYADWKKAVVNIDYHVELKGHYYSVPHAYRRERVEIRHTSATVEIFLGGQRIASHIRDYRLGKHTTVAQHMPKSHQSYLEWTPSRIIQWAGNIGPSAKKVAEIILTTKPHPEQGYRSCLGIISLGKRFGNDRLEAACRRAVEIGGKSYRSVRSILESGLDQKPLEPARTIPEITHANVRGPGYYGSASPINPGGTTPIDPHQHPRPIQNVAITSNGDTFLTADPQKQPDFKNNNERMDAC
jgi:transposase